MVSLIIFPHQEDSPQQSPAKLPPLSRNLRVSSSFAKASADKPAAAIATKIYPFGGPLSLKAMADSFQSACETVAVRWPESFRGGCSFGGFSVFWDRKTLSRNASRSLPESADQKAVV